MTGTFRLFSSRSLLVRLSKAARGSAAPSPWLRRCSPGLGFSPFYAAAICLLANTAPVAFGSIGIPITTLAQVTQLPVDRLSAGVGRICAPVSLFIPAYLIMVMSGWKGLKSVFPAAAACGITFAGDAVPGVQLHRPGIDRYPGVARCHGSAVARDSREGRGAAFQVYGWANRHGVGALCPAGGFRSVVGRDDAG